MDDDLIATSIYSFRALQEAGTIGVHWCHLYGWPVESAEEDRLAAQEAGERPCEYLGMVLLSLSTEPDESAKKQKKQTAMAQAPEECKYQLRCDIFQVSELPETVQDRKIYVEVGLGPNPGDNWRETREVKLEGTSSMQWLTGGVASGGSIKLTADYPKIKKSNVYLESQVPDIFVRVMSYGYCIGYQRFPYNLKTRKELAQAKIKWYSLKPYLFHGAVPPGVHPGYIQFRLQFGVKAELGGAPAWPATNYKDYIVRAHIYQGKDLPAYDDNGMSDPFLEIRFGSAKAITKTMPETLYPRWYETVEFTVGLPTNQEMRPDINVLVFDEDDYGAADQIGRFVVQAKTIQPKFNPDPQWYDVFKGDPENAENEGQILCSFQLFTASDKDSMVAKGEEFYGPEGSDGIKPEQMPCKIQVLVIGIRNMEAYNFMEVSNPIVEINGGSLESVARTETGSGPNHSWVEMLELSLDLPKLAVYAPNVNLTILDDRGVFLGECDVGKGSIPVAPYMEWTGEKPPAPPPAIPDTAFDDPDAEPESISEVPETKADFYPSNVDELNEYVHEEFAYDPLTKSGGFTFEVSEKEGAGAGKRTMGDVEKTDVEGKDDEEEDDDGPKKEKPRETIPTQWEVSQPDMVGCSATYSGFEKEHRPPFHTYEIKRGQRGGSAGWGLGASNGEKVVATLKLQCRAFEVGGSSANKPSLKDKHASTGRDQRMHVRLYVIQGMNLMSKDENGLSDPFLNVELTNHPKWFDKDRTKQNETLQPLFYVMYEFRDCTMPGDHTLNIEVWDYDFLGDDLIGKAAIDIEDRWYSDRWSDHDEDFLKKRPKELVPLWSPMSGTPQGRLEIWIDTLTEAQFSSIPAEKMERPRGEPWELRGICWRVDDVVFRELQYLSMMVSATLEYRDISDNKMYKMPRVETDHHNWIAPGEPGVFHWRWVIPCKIPCKDPRLLIQTWNLELLSPNSSLAECNLALGGVFKKAAQEKRRQKMPLPQVTLTHPNYAGSQGTIRLDLDAIPQEEAQQQPVVSGGPDIDPTLMKYAPYDDFFRPDNGYLATLAAGLDALNPFAAMQRMAMYACCALIVVGGLGAVAMLAVM